MLDLSGDWGFNPLWCLSTPKFVLTPRKSQKIHCWPGDPLWFSHKSSTGVLQSSREIVYEYHTPIGYIPNTLDMSLHPGYILHVEYTKALWRFRPELQLTSCCNVSSSDSDILFLQIIFTATFSPVMTCFAFLTTANWPSPMKSPMSYSPAIKIESLLFLELLDI